MVKRKRFIKKKKYKNFMSEKKTIVVSSEREVSVGHIVTDLITLFGCDTSTPKPLVTLTDIVIANYWLSRGDQPPLYQVSCRGVAQQGQKYLEKAYQVEVSTIYGEPISEELKPKIIDIIRKSPSD